jgi:transcriptional regulator with XRE-family HTH domain
MIRGGVLAGRMTRKGVENSEYDQYLLRLGARIKEYRLARGWSQHYVCKTFDFYESHWRLLEQGKVISVPSLYKIAKVYEIDPSELLSGLYIVDSKEDAPAKEA